MLLKCKVFSATLARDRDALGERVSDFIRNEVPIKIVDRQVLLSSDSEFHCLVIVLWYELLDGESSRP